MKIKISTLNTPRFLHEGLDINEHWQEVDTEKLTPAGLDGLEQYFGRVIQVHPDDSAGFVKSTGLQNIDGLLVLPKVDGEDTRPQVGERHQRSEEATEVGRTRIPAELRNARVAAGTTPGHSVPPAATHPPADHQPDVKPGSKR